MAGALAAGVAWPGAAWPQSAPHLLHARAGGYDGVTPGPLLRVRRGEEIGVRLINELSQPTAVHWHGVRLPNAMDGAPPLTQDPVAPGASFDYRFTPRDAGTFWYHASNAPSLQTQRNLYGALIVDEAEPVDVDQDIALVFAGAEPTADAAFKDAPRFTVNGAAHFDIRSRAHERLRLRLLNASDRLMLNLRIANLRTFVMATDGQPAEPFAAREGRLSLGPGNRIDVFVDCRLDPGATTPIMIEGANGEAAAVAHIACVTGAPARPALRDDPAPLPPNPLPERMDFAGAFRFKAAAGDAPAKASGHPSPPQFRVKTGRTVVLALSNQTSENRYIHLHGHSFRLLDALDDGWKPFWLDTLPLLPQSEVRVAFVADNPGRWLIEGLAASKGPPAWFEVS